MWVVVKFISGLSPPQAALCVVLQDTLFRVLASVVRGSDEGVLATTPIDITTPTHYTGRGRKEKSFKSIVYSRNEFSTN